MSPWTDLTLKGSSYDTRAEADPIFTRGALAALAGTYLQGQDASDPRCSPILGAAPQVPIRIDVGEDEVLLDDAIAYAKLAADAGTMVTLGIWQGMPHVFQARIGELLGAAKAFDAAGSFIERHLAR